MMAAISISVPAARLLTRTDRGGRGFKSRPLGASIGAERVSAFSFTVDLHLACFLSAAKNQFGLLEQAIDDVHVVFHPVVDHLLLAVRADHNENRRFPVLGGLADLDVGLLAIVEDPDGTYAVITLQPVVEKHRFDCVRWK